MDDEVVNQISDPQPRKPATALRASTVTKRSATNKTNKESQNDEDEGKIVKGPAKTNGPKAILKDPSYRAPKVESDSDEDLNVKFVAGDLPVLVQAVDKISPSTARDVPALAKAVQVPSTPPPPSRSRSKATSTGKQRPKVAIHDPSYRPPRVDSESDEEMGTKFVPGDLPVNGRDVGQVQSTPVTSITSVYMSPPPTQPRPPREARPPRPPQTPPTPTPTPMTTRLHKRRRLDDPTYRPSWDSEGSSFDDEDDDESDEGIRGMKGVVKEDIRWEVKRRKKGRNKAAKKAVAYPEEAQEEEKSDGVVMEDGEEGRKATVNKKAKSASDPSYRPSQDEEDDSDEYNDEWSSTDGGSKRRRGVRVQKGHDVPTGKTEDDGDVNVNPSVNGDGDPNDNVVPQEQIVLCETRPCLPPKFGRNKIKMPKRHRRPRIHDPSYKPGGTSSDEDSNGFESAWSWKEGEEKRKREKAKLNEVRFLPMTDMKEEVIRRMLGRHGRRFEAAPTPAVTTKAEHPQGTGRQTTGQPLGPSNTTSDDCSGSEWESSDDWSVYSDMDVEGRRKNGRRRTNKAHSNGNETASGMGIMAGKEDLGIRGPPETNEETQADKGRLHQPTPKKARRKRRRKPLELDGTYRYRPSDTTSDEYNESDEWESSDAWSAYSDSNGERKRKKGRRKTRRVQANENNPPPGVGTATGQEDLEMRDHPEANEEETQADAKPLRQPKEPKRKPRRRPLDLDGVYKPSTDSSESEPESGPISDLDQPVSANLKVISHIKNPDPPLRLKGELPVSPLSLEEAAPQIQIDPRTLVNVKTAFYPLCHGRYAPWPPAPGTVYCQPCFREQVLVRGLLIQRGISETMRLLKVSLGGGPGFGKELNVALEEVLDGVETEQMRSASASFCSQGQYEDVQRQERVQPGEGTRTKAIHSARSSPRKLPEDVQTLLVLRRLADLVKDSNENTFAISTEHPTRTDKRSTTTNSTNILPVTDAVVPKPCSQYQDPTGPSRYSGPLAPPQGLITHSEVQTRTGTSIGMNMSYFSLKPSSTSPFPFPSPSPLDIAINILHDAIGISTWQARRLWNQYGGARVWDLAKVDSLVKRYRVKYVNGRQVRQIKREPQEAERETRQTDIGTNHDEHDQAVLHALKGVADLEEDIRKAHTESVSREGQKRTWKQTGQGQKTGRLSSGKEEGRKRSRDKEDCSFSDWDHGRPPTKKAKFTRPIDLSRPKSQDAAPSLPWIPTDKPTLIPCHSCFGFNTVKYNSGAALRRIDDTETGGRPWTETLQWALDISKSEAAKMTLDNFLYFISQNGKTAHVKKSGWEFVVHHQGGTNDGETRIVFLDVRPGLDFHL